MKNINIDKLFEQIDAAIFKQADELMYEDKKAKKKPGEEIR